MTSMLHLARSGASQRTAVNYCKMLALREQRRGGHRWPAARSGQPSGQRSSNTVSPRGSRALPGSVLGARAASVGWPRATIVRT
jgi:hypothetical protein